MIVRSKFPEVHKGHEVTVTATASNKGIWNRHKEKILHSKIGQTV